MGQGFSDISDFPKDFRQKELARICGVVARGQSAQIVGPTGSGKSLLLKALINSDKIKSHHLGRDYSSYEFVLVDLKYCIEKDLISLLRFMISRLAADAESSADLSLLILALDSVISQRQAEKKHLVIIFDSFNELPNPDKLFEILKGIYDKHRGKLNYIFAVNHEVDLEANFENFKNLASIIAENIIYISPLDEKEFNWFIHELENYMDLKLNDSEKKKVFALTGGYMSTVKRVMEAIGEGENLKDIEIYPDKIQRIALHIKVLLEDLTTETKTLKNIIENKLSASDAKNLKYLKKTSVINSSNNFLIPLLKTYLENTSNINNSERKENINGKISLHSKLTPLEFKITKFLCNHLEEFCTRDDIIENVYGTKSKNGVSDHSIDQIIYRLRKKLERNDPQLKIETVWGRGHKAVLIS